MWDITLRRGQVVLSVLSCCSGAKLRCLLLAFNLQTLFCGWFSFICGPHEQCHTIIFPVWYMVDFSIQIILFPHTCQGYYNRGNTSVFAVCFILHWRGTQTYSTHWKKRNRTVSEIVDFWEIAPNFEIKAEVRQSAWSKTQSDPFSLCSHAHARKPPSNPLCALNVNKH